MIDWCDRLGAAIEAREALPRWRLIKRRTLLNAIEFLTEMCRRQETAEPCPEEGRHRG